MINITNSLCRVTKLEDKTNSAKEVVAITGKLYYGVKNKESGEYDNEFVNCTFVGEGCKKAVKVDIQDKNTLLIESGILRNKPYTDKSGNPRVFTEIVIFDFKFGDEIPKQEHEQAAATTSRRGGKNR